MRENRPIITLLTDFGEADAFVGIMKGVILSILPQAQLVDLTHQIPPQDIKQAAYILTTAVPFFPEGTVHLVVVDPGVGSDRHPIAVETSRARFVAPDNGVLSYALAQAGDYRVVELANPAFHLPQVSSTFHGRDIFSPAAAKLASGIPLDEFGPPVDSPVMIEPPRLKVKTDRIEAEVLNVDNFGNLRTSIHTLTWEDDATLILRPIFGSLPEGAPVARFDAKSTHVSVRGRRIEGVSLTFSAVQPHQPLAYVGSEGGLEIAVNRGNAARELGVKPGDKITLHYQQRISDR
jgi:S-adenosylmethionine hydrolase